MKTQRTNVVHTHQNPLKAFPHKGALTGIQEMISPNEFGCRGNLEGKPKVGRMCSMAALQK